MNKFAYAGKEALRRKESSEVEGELWSFLSRGLEAQAAVNDICANRHKGNSESVAAFQSIKDKLRNGQQSVLREIARTPSGLTAEEIADRLNTTVNCVSGRCAELKKLGKVRKAGTRPVRSGHSAAILVAI